MVRAALQGIGRLYARSRWTRLAGDAASVIVFFTALALAHALLSWWFLQEVRRVVSWPF